MRRLLIQPRARVDLLEIWDYIARDDVNAANRVVGRIEEEIHGLVDMPGKGHTRADVPGLTYRFWSVWSFIIAYQFDDASLTVIRVVHGHRDFRQTFRNEQ